MHVFATSGSGGEAALQMIRDVTASAEIGKTYLGKVVRLAEFGAFVEIFPGTDGLLHISEIAEQRIRDVRDELKLGDQVLVKVLAIEGNKIRLSRKALIKEAREKAQKKEAAASAGGDGSSSAAVVSLSKLKIASEVNKGLWFRTRGLVRFESYWSFIAAPLAKAEIRILILGAGAGVDRVESAPQCVQARLGSTREFALRLPLAFSIEPVAPRRTVRLVCLFVNRKIRGAFASR